MPQLDVKRNQVLTNSCQCIVHLSHTGNIEQRDERLVRDRGVGKLQRIGRIGNTVDISREGGNQCPNGD